MNGTEKERGENRDLNGDGNGEGGPSGAEMRWERRKGRQARAGRTVGDRGKKKSVGRGYVGVMGVV